MSGYGDIRVEAGVDVKLVTLPESERHLVLACKAAYNRNIIYDVLRVYKHFYGNTSRKPFSEIALILLGIIYRYNVIETELGFQDFVCDAVFGKHYNWILRRDRGSELYRLIVSCISRIQLWQVHNRSDHYDYNLGKADLF